MSNASFKRLSESTSLYEPNAKEVNASRGSIQAPNTILLFGWMGGSPRNIAKYTAGYQLLYPSARIVLVTSSLPDLLRTPAMMRQRAQASFPAIRSSENLQCQNGTGLLVHAFSNGGVMNLVAVSKYYRETQGSPLPARALVLDSAAGGDRFVREWKRWIKTLSVGLPRSRYVRWPAQLLIVVALGVLLGLRSLLGIENPAASARRGSNNDDLISSRGRRCYLYSEDDELIGWRDVEEHAASAVGKGWEVETNKFKGSSHVEHARVNAEGYWAAVKRTWDPQKYRAEIQQGKKK